MFLEADPAAGRLESFLASGTLPNARGYPLDPQALHAARPQAKG
jgi:hypothetical protein